MKYLLAGILAIAVLSGCSSAQKMGDVQLGMTRDQVVGVLGKPDSVRGQGNVEQLQYELATFSGNPWYQTYYVRLVNGKVVSYGQ